MTRSRDTANTQENTGGALPPFVAGKNKIINGDFGIWQRGTSFNSVANPSYTADRWQITYDGTSTSNITQQTFTPGTAPVSGYEGAYFYRYTLATKNTATYFAIFQPIEDVRTFANQTVTLSFWAKADTTRTLKAYLAQNFGTGGSAFNNNIGLTSLSLTSSWARYSVTISVPSISGKTIGTASSLNVYLFSDTVANGQYVDIWGVQLEAGSVATPFTTATGTLQGELAACQRYYIRFGGDSVYQNYGNGTISSTTNSVFIINLPVTLRVAPSSVDWSTVAMGANGGANNVPTAIVIGQSGKTIVQISATGTGFSPSTANTPAAIFSNNSTSGYLGFSAEL